MKYMNKTMLKGRIGAAPELRRMPSGAPVVHFSVATRMGQHVEWHRCTAFDDLAEDLARDFGQGDGVYVEGELRTRELPATSETARKRTIRELVVKEAHIIEKAKAGKPDADDLAGQGDSASPEESQAEAFVKAKPNELHHRPAYC